jgi:hypothetical protein
MTRHVRARAGFTVYSTACGYNAYHVRMCSKWGGGGGDCGRRGGFLLFVLGSLGLWLRGSRGHSRAVPAFAFTCYLQMGEIPDTGEEAHVRLENVIGPRWRICAVPRLSQA